MRSETENRVLISICHGFLYGNWSSSVTPNTVSIHKLNHEKDNSSTLHWINLCRWLYQNQQDDNNLYSYLYFTKSSENQYWCNYRYLPVKYNYFQICISKKYFAVSNFATLYDWYSRCQNFIFITVYIVTTIWLGFTYSRIVRV